MKYELPARLVKESQMYKREMSRRVDRLNDRLRETRKSFTLVTYLQCLVREVLCAGLNLTSMLKTEHGFSSLIFSQLVCH